METRFRRSKPPRGLGFAGLLALIVVFDGTAARAQSVAIRALSARGSPGGRVSFDVKVATGGRQVASLQNDIGYNAKTPVLATSGGLPDCTVNPNISDRGAMSLSTTFRPIGCKGSACSSMRAILTPAGMNLFSIPDGTTLYTCRVNILPSTAPGTYPLAVSQTAAANEAGSPVPVTGASGSIVVATSGS